MERSSGSTRFKKSKYHSLVISEQNNLGQYFQQTMLPGYRRPFIFGLYVFQRFWGQQIQHRAILFINNNCWGAIGCMRGRKIKVAKDEYSLIQICNDVMPYLSSCERYHDVCTCMLESGNCTWAVRCDQKTTARLVGLNRVMCSVDDYIWPTGWQHATDFVLQLGKHMSHWRTWTNVVKTWWTTRQLQHQSLGRPKWRGIVRRVCQRRDISDSHA
jgi:hypothetical protein